MAYLERHEILKSQDLDDLQVRMARDISPYGFRLLERGARIDARICAAPLAELSLLHAEYGRTGMEVRAPALDEGGFLLCVLTGGSGRFEQAGEVGEMSTERAMIRDLRHGVMGQQTDFSAFALPVPRARLHALMEALYGPEATRQPLRFEASADLCTPAGRHLRETLHFVAGQLDALPAGAAGPLLLGTWEELLLTQILNALPHSHSDLAAARRGQAQPVHVKRARDFIHGNAHERLRLADLAQAAGCSLRTLQGAFAEHTGLPPMAYLQAVRLERAHRALSDAPPGTTVAEVARRWGFAHGGRFAAAYRERYGRTPADTLRRG